MGEVDVSVMGGFEIQSTNGVHTEHKHDQAGIAVGDKVVFFGGELGGILTNEIRILDTPTGKRVTPMVLGTKPSPRQGHSAVPLSNDRILILGGGSEPKDNIWFLELDSPYVKQQRKIQGKEVVAWSKGVVGETPQPIVISGPSGVGKGTLISKLMQEFPSTFGFSVSHTTRLPREKEVNGVHYHFTERKVMEVGVKEGKFLEYANVHGNLYGTSIASVEAVADAGKRCILDIDVQGAESVKNSTLKAVFIFISPPSFAELEKRLRGRGTEKEEQIQKRLANARQEIEQAHTSSLFNHILVNGDLDSCYSKLKEILGLSKDPFAFSTSNDVVQSSVEDLVHLPGQSVTLMDKKVTISGGIKLDGMTSNNRYVLDLSSIGGGAPGRTQGLRLNVVEESKLQLQ